MTNVKIVFSYSADPAILAATKEFFCYPVDPTTHVRLSPTATLVIPVGQIPTVAAPAIVSMNGIGKQCLQVVAYDGTTEGVPAYLDVVLQLPAVANVVRVS